MTYTEKESVDECIKAAPHKIDNKTVETKRAVPRDACTPDVLAKTKKVCTQKCLGYKLIKPNINSLELINNQQEMCNKDLYCQM